MLNEGSVRDNSYRKENSREQNQECDERIAQLDRGKKNLPQKKAEKEKVLDAISWRLVECNNANMKFSASSGIAFAALSRKPTRPKCIKSCLLLRVMVAGLLLKKRTLLFVSTRFLGLRPG